jgi:hypothetical protein
MEAELESVLADPSFVRSPVLARLLAYLVERTIGGEAQSLKSYAVAVEGLGRSPDLDPQVDTYARVQVVRLRKALDSYYASAGAPHGQRLLIDAGSYGVKLVPNAHGTSRRPARFALALPRGRGWRIALPVALVAALVLAAALVAHWQRSSQAAAERWRANDNPSLAVDLHDHTTRGSGAAYGDFLRQELLMRMGRYQALRIFYDRPAGSTYVVRIDLYQSGKDLLANTLLVERAQGRLLWSTSDVIPIAEAEGHFRESDYISRTAFTIAQPTGIIHSSERRSGHTTDTPYGCWLRFTALQQNNYIVADGPLSDCAAAWHSAAPEHPVAAGLYGWTLIDQSIVQASDARRRKLLGQALETLERARSLNPASGFLNGVLVRGYAFAGEDEAMVAAANQALKLNPGNLEIQGLAGSMLALRNHPQGEAMLDEALAHRTNPPPWFFIAKFVAAMMREDTAGAGRALGQLRQINHSLPVLPVFSAAYEARTGQLAKARSSWEQAKAMQPVIRMNPDLFFERTPLSAEVTARLKKWLGPVLRRSD